MQLLEGKEPGAASNLEREEREAWIRQAVEELPEQLRGALALVYYQGMKYREAAEVLGDSGRYSEEPSARRHP